MENLATEQRPTAGWSCPTPRVSIACASSPACGSTAPPFWLVNQPGSYGLQARLGQSGARRFRETSPGWQTQAQIEVAASFLFEFRAQKSVAVSLPRP